MSYGNKDFIELSEFANKEGYVDFLDNKFIKKTIESLSFTNESLLQDEYHIKKIKKIVKDIKLKKGTFTNIFTVDGGYQVVEIGKGTNIAFFKIGVNNLNLNDFFSLNKKEHILPSEINKINLSEKMIFILPLTNFSLKNEEENILDYFIKEILKEYKLEDTLVELYNYDKQNKKEKSDVINDFLSIFNNISLEDTQKINKNLGTIMSVIEQLLLFKKIIEQKKENSLKDFLFIRDGTLSFLKETPFLTGLRHYVKNNLELNLISLEKSGILDNYIAEYGKFFKEGLIKVDQHFLKKYIKYEDYNGRKNYYDGYYARKYIYYKNDKNYTILNIANKDFGQEKEQIEKCNLDKLSKILYLLDVLKSQYYTNSVLPVIFINKDVSISQDSREILKEIIIRDLNNRK